MSGSSAAGAAPSSLSFESFPFSMPITTRWTDNDIYQHANNIQYLSWIDTTLNTFLIRHAGLDIRSPDAVVGFCVHSECSYRASVAFPETVHAAVRIDRQDLGRSSVRYTCAVFRDSTPRELCAHGTFTHVFVQRAASSPPKSTPIPARVREAFEKHLLYPPTQ